MALTKEYEYDCEVRGLYKAVQVRQATIVKDDGVEISRTYHRHVLQCRTKSGDTWATPTSAVKTHLYRPCATPCGLTASSLPMKHS